MVKYAALLRGIGPGNPNMRNEKLREVFEKLGFDNVKSVISSGNILFETPSIDVESLESSIEEAIPLHLGFNSSVVIRSHAELQKIVDLDPFKGLTHGVGSYLLVTFFKQPTKVDFKIPYQPKDKPYKIIGANKDCVFSITDNSVIKTSDLMTWLEKEFGKDITSRTYLTVNRILKKFEGYN